jgi:predicted PurR-regulated permease PerM
MDHSDLRKINSVLIFGFAVLAALYFGAGFLIPFVFAAFLAALMEPLASKMEKIGLSRFVSSFISALTVFIVIGGLSYLFFYQLRLFTEDLPQIETQLREFLRDMQQRFSAATGISPEEQKSLFQERSDDLTATLENQLTLFLGSLLLTTLKFLLTLIYLFLFLLNRGKYGRFLLKYVPPEKEEQAREIMEQTGTVAHRYLWGRIQVMSLLAIMYLIAFAIFDIPYAVLLTIFGGLITIIPYIGPFISGILPVVFAIVFGMGFSQVLIFAGVILVIQLIESYVLEPVIIGAEVQLSPLAVIIAVIIGGAVWGIAGMILFVPIFAVCKILFDHTPALEPLGFLIGNGQKAGEGIGTKLKKLIRGFVP